MFGQGADYEVKDGAERLLFGRGPFEVVAADDHGICLRDKQGTIYYVHVIADGGLYIQHGARLTP